MIDYHVHLWPHSERAEPAEQRLERLSLYCERAAAEGVDEIALTEHLFRFRQGRAAVGDFWKDDPKFAKTMGSYFDHHATADLDEYVEAALAAKQAGLPVVVGLEVDYYQGQMDAVGRLLDGYPFDVLLGSVHWIGHWQFDLLHDDVSMAEWSRRSVDDAWRAYTEALFELAETRTCDVLAHPDMIKIAGYLPTAATLDECHDRIAEAAARSGMAAELSSAGFRQPCEEQFTSRSLLEKFFRRGVPLTTASDTHGISRVASRAAELGTMAADTGYRSLRAYRGRKGTDVPIFLAESAAT